MWTYEDNCGAVCDYIGQSNYSSSILIFVGAARTVAQEGTNSSQRAQKYPEVLKKIRKQVQKRPDVRILKKSLWQMQA